MPAFSQLPLAPAVSDADLLAIVHAGVTSRTTRADFLAGITDNILPAQTGQAGRYLSTNGTTASWQPIVIPSVPVTSVFGRVGDILAQAGDYSVGQVTGAAPLASPVFTGNPTAPTPANADNSVSVATTAFVKNQGYLTSAPAAAVTSVFGRTGAVLAQLGDYSGISQGGGSVQVNSDGSVSVSPPTGFKVQIQNAFTIYQNGGESHIDAIPGQQFLFDGGGGPVFIKKGSTAGTIRINDSGGLPYVGWFSSGSTELLRVGNIGTHYAVLQSMFAGPIYLLGPDAATAVCAIQGAASQTGNLLECQNSSGALLVGFQADGNLRTANAVSATTPGSVVKKLPLYDASGVLLGFLPVYSSIA
jgi:hypothetical protein